MKFVLSVLFIAIVFVYSSLACDIKFKILSNQKDKYNVNDEFIVKVTVYFTHKNCSEGINNTNFVTDGMKISSATKWTEVEPGIFERKLKIQVVGTKNGKMALKAVRKCKKEGGLGTMKLACIPVK